MMRRKKCKNLQGNMVSHFPMWWIRINMSPRPMMQYVPLILDLIRRELEYRGRIDDKKMQDPAGRILELYNAMMDIANTGKGPRIRTVYGLFD